MALEIHTPSIDLCHKYLIKSKCKLRNVYSEVEFIIADGISRASNKNYHIIHKIFCDFLDKVKKIYLQTKQFYTLDIFLVNSSKMVYVRNIKLLIWANVFSLVNIFIVSLLSSMRISSC